MQTWDDARLLADRNRPGESFAVFYRRHATSVLAFFSRRNVEVSRAAILTAAVFESALHSRYRYSPDRTSAAPWLHGLATAQLAADELPARALRRTLRTRSAPRVDLDARDRAEYMTLAFGPFDVLDVLAERPRYRPVAGVRPWSASRVRRTEDARG